MKIMKSFGLKKNWYTKAQFSEAEKRMMTLDIPEKVIAKLKKGTVLMSDGEQITFPDPGALAALKRFVVDYTYDIPFLVAKTKSGDIPGYAVLSVEGEAYRDEDIQDVWTRSEPVKKEGEDSYILYGTFYNEPRPGEAGWMGRGLMHYERGGCVCATLSSIS